MFSQILRLVLFSMITIGFWECSFAEDGKKTLRESIEEKYSARIQLLSKQIQNSPKQINLYSSRGDAYFFTGQFKKALSDYTQMVELDSSVDTSHWRRGIAYFYVEDYAAAAAQFDRYHNFDNVDRENGIWRYLSQYHSKGAQAARKELLKYDKDDREPFGDVYRLFAGAITDEEIVQKILKAEISPTEREKRLFYATLYIGLNSSVEGDHKRAAEYLTQAVNNKWPMTAGYGPNYMWHVARLHLDLMKQNESNDQSAHSETR